MMFRTLFTSLFLTAYLGCNGFSDANAAAPAPVLKPMSIQVCHLAKTYQLPRDVSQVRRSMVIVQNKANIGSGVIVSESGYILTAAHLVQDAEQVAVYLDSGATLSGNVVRLDAWQDIALIKIPDAQYPCLPMMTARLPAGSRIFSLGFSLEGNNGFVLHEGKVKSNRFNRANGPFYMQTNLDLKPGHSGGPLLNRNGQVAGIISWKMRVADSGVFSFGTPVSTVKPTMKISWKD